MALIFISGLFVGVGTASHFGVGTTGEVAALGPFRLVGVVPARKFGGGHGM
jgi:hypothetical protein